MAEPLQRAERQAKKIASNKVTDTATPEGLISQRERAFGIVYLNISDVAYHLSVENECTFRFIDVNPAFYKATQLKPDQVIGKLVSDVIPEPSLSTVLAHYKDAIRTGFSQYWEETTEYPAGRKVGQVSVTPVFDADHRCTDLVGTVRDISELVYREEKLREAHLALEQAFATQARLADTLSKDEQRLRLALEGTGEGVWDWRIDQDKVYLSSMWKQIVGLSPEETECREVWLKRIHPDDVDAVQSRLDRCLNSPDEGYVCEYRLWHEAGHWIWVRARGSVVERDATGAPLRMIGTLTDITQAFVLREQLDRSRSRLEQLAEQVPGALFEMSMGDDGIARCAYISAMSTDLFELSPEEAMADCHRLLDRITPRDRLRLYRALQKSRAQLAPFRLEFQVDLPKNGKCWREVSARPTQCAGKPTIWRGFIDDISLRKKNEETIRLFNEKLERRAHYDTLTNLPNRALFRDRLEQAVRHADSAGGQIALFFIDLDRFKEVNDLLGHDAGDELLTEAARRIEACVTKGDTVARLGGDEFTVILTESRTVAHVEQIAQQILDELSHPFHIKSEQVQVAGSVGIARFPDDARDPEELMRNADHAMYKSKSSGRNQLTFFEPRMQRAALYRLKLISDLRHALPDGQFLLHFQPIVELKTGRVFKAEALLRWRRSSGELVAPAKFIAVAEESGLIHEIGNWVFRTAAEYARQWSAIIGRTFQISINKSPMQFQPHLRTINWVEWLNEQDIPAGCINVEITEGVLLNLSENVFDKLKELQVHGIEVAIDDFGTGYSSMNYLKRLHIDYLKIDQSFTAEMLSDATSSTITETIIMMAHKLGLRVIAEGVETRAQNDWLISHGCDYGQGFLFSQPLEADVFEQMLRSTETNLRPAASGHTP